MTGTRYRQTCPFCLLRELVDVGLFDAIREKAGELLSGATEKVGELTGVEDLSQSATDAAGQVTDAAGEQVSGVAEDLPGSVDLPEVPPEYRP